MYRKHTLFKNVNVASSFFKVMLSILENVKYMQTKVEL